jgi:hypothetical protein
MFLSIVKDSNFHSEKEEKKKEREREKKKGKRERRKKEREKKKDYFEQKISHFYEGSFSRLYSAAPADKNVKLRSNFTFLSQPRPKPSILP